MVFHADKLTDCVVNILWMSPSEYLAAGNETWWLDWCRDIALRECAGRIRTRIDIPLAPGVDDKLLLSALSGQDDATAGNADSNGNTQHHDVVQNE